MWSAVCALLMQEVNAYRGKLGTLFNFDWISIPLVYTQVISIPLVYTQVISIPLVYT